MSDTRLPIEVELAYEVMPCLALRSGQEPVRQPHACSYFRKWGSYHSYDYTETGPPATPGIVQNSVYVGRAPLVPELLSGCRKAPILAVGINPNLPGWWGNLRSSLNPLFDDYKQYAHYFRYRAIAKLQIPKADYQEFGGGPDDQPLTDFELNVPRNAAGERVVSAELKPQKMYQNYQALLDDLAVKMNWQGHQLTVGEDLAYGNMVACPSAKWATQSDDPSLPVMTVKERNGIVQECFHERKYFLRQLFQSLPRVILIFSQATARAFITELRDRFTSGDPSPSDSMEDLMNRNVRLQYGLLPDGTALEARVIFSPHITGTPAQFQLAKPKVVAQLVAEAEAGRLEFNPATKHLRRPQGACVFCTMLEIGKCDYVAELKPLSTAPSLTADSPASDLHQERLIQLDLMGRPQAMPAAGWDADDDRPTPPSGEATETAPGAPVVRIVRVAPPAGFPDLAAGEVDEDTGPTFILRGRIVTMSDSREVIDDGRLCISKGFIRAVLRPGAALPAGFSGAREVDVEGTIYPGLIDLHNHFVYNVLPLWVVPKKYENREQWPRHPEYKKFVSLPMKGALTKSLLASQAIIRYVEAKAIIGGSTTGQGILTQTKAGRKVVNGAMRNVEATRDKRLPSASTRVPNLAGANNIEQFRRALEGPGVHFYHLSEGVDDRARRHFLNLKDQDLLAPTLVGVHSLALKREDLDLMAAAEARIVWSPFSNALLYSGMLDLKAVKQSGVRFSIGCDWSPSGSKNLLQEIKVAAFMNEKSGSPFSEADLVGAVTSGAAEVLGWGKSLGRISDGRMADLLVLSGKTGDAYAQLIKATEKDVRLVTIHGVARYGDEAIMKRLHLAADQPKLEVWNGTGKAKAFWFETTGSPINGVSFATAMSRLKDAMSDLPAFAASAAEESAQLAAFGMDDEVVHLELDNELEDDPLSPYDGSTVDAQEAALAADVTMPESLPLDEPVVGGADYWKLVEDQKNIPAGLAAHLKTSYGA